MQVYDKAKRSIYARETSGIDRTHEVSAQTPDRKRIDVRGLAANDGDGDERPRQREDAAVVLATRLQRELAISQRLHERALGRRRLAIEVRKDKDVR